MFSAMSWGLYQRLPSLYALFLISLLGPLVIFLLFRMIRTSYVKQVAISVAKKVKYKSLTRYVLLSGVSSQRLLTCLLSARCVTVIFL